MVKSILFKNERQQTETNKSSCIFKYPHANGSALSHGFSLDILPVYNFNVAIYISHNNGNPTHYYQLYVKNTDALIKESYYIFI